MAGKFLVLGIKEIDAVLRDLEPKVGKKVINKELRQTAKVFQKAAKQNAPIGETGDLKRNIKVRAQKKSRQSFGLNTVIGEGDFKGETFYGAMVEYGTSKQPPQGFMRRAFDANKSSETTRLERSIRDGLEQIAKQSAK